MVQEWLENFYTFHFHPESFIVGIHSNLNKKINKKKQPRFKPTVGE